MDTVLDYEGHDKQQYELVTSLAALFKQPQLIARWRKNGKAIFNASWVELLLDSKALQSPKLVSEGCCEKIPYNALFKLILRL